MIIKGVGNVKKAEAMRFMSSEGRKAVKDGLITNDELAAMYKLELVKKSAKCGNFVATFSANFDRIPEDVFENLTPEQLGALVDAFNKCYHDGVEYGREHEE